MNQLGATLCPSVICQHSGPAFKWEQDGCWIEGDELPKAVLDVLPLYEWGRCQAHRFRRLGDRVGAA